MDQTKVNLFLRELVRYLQNAEYRSSVEAEFKQIEIDFGQAEKAHIAAKRLVSLFFM